MFKCVVYLYKKHKTLKAMKKITNKDRFLNGEPFFCMKWCDFPNTGAVYTDDRDGRDGGAIFCCGEGFYIKHIMNVGYPHKKGFTEKGVWGYKYVLHRQIEIFIPYKDMIFGLTYDRTGKPIENVWEFVNKSKKK